jgi:hypothetical protein
MEWLGFIGFRNCAAAAPQGRPVTLMLNRLADRRRYSMTSQPSAPWLRRFGTAIHLALALPWAAEAGAILLLAFTGDTTGPVHLAAAPAAATSIALLLARRLWLVNAAVVGTAVAFFGVLGIALNYIDHSPGNTTAKFALDATWAAFIAGLVASALALVVGVLEWRAGRR